MTSVVTSSPPLWAAASPHKSLKRPAPAWSVQENAQDNGSLSGRPQPPPPPFGFDAVVGSLSAAYPSSMVDGDEPPRSGTTGHVARAFATETAPHCAYAVKILHTRPDAAAAARIAAMVHLSRSHDDAWPSTLVRYRRAAYFALGDRAIVMDYVPGRPLSDDAGCLVSEACVARWLVDVAAALAFLHARGVVHRDVHARNILLVDRLRTPCKMRPASDDDRPLQTRAVLIDLDAACAPDATPWLAGAPVHVLARAPETFFVADSAGASFDMWARSDVWALGVTLTAFAAGDLFTAGLVARMRSLNKRSFGCDAERQDVQAMLHAAAAARVTRCVALRHTLCGMTEAEPLMRPTAREVAARDFAFADERCISQRRLSRSTGSLRSIAAALDSAGGPPQRSQSQVGHDDDYITASL